MENVKLEIGYYSIETKNGVVERAELIEVSLPSSEIPRVEQFKNATAGKQPNMETKKFMQNQIITQDFDPTKPAIGRVLSVTQDNGVLNAEVEFTKEFLAMVKNAKNT